jgi:hypothetical protein
MLLLLAGEEAVDEVEDEDESDGDSAGADIVRDRPSPSSCVNEAGGIGCRAFPSVRIGGEGPSICSKAARAKGANTSMAETSNCKSGWKSKEKAVRGRRRRVVSDERERKKERIGVKDV